MSKACNSGDQHILIDIISEKVEDKWTRDTIIDVILNYNTQIADIYFNWDSDVPQGSVLSP